MDRTAESKSKTLVPEALDTLFNKSDYVAAEKFWSPHYIQHSGHIAPGREGLFNLIKTLPPTLKCEHGTTVAEGNFVWVRILMSYGAMCSAADSSRALIPFQTICAPIQTRRNDDSFIITDIPVSPRTRASRLANP